MDAMIPVSRPSVGEEEIEAIRAVFKTGWLGLGSTVFEFENAIGEFLGGREVVAVATGTAALHLALSAIGVAAGDEVIVPSLTFCASVQAITALGGVPVFCEIDPRTLNIDVEDAARRITARTRAIMPVHYCGNPCDMDTLLALAERHGAAVVEDAAHAFGSSWKGQRIGSFGHATCFSFDPIKVVTCGEGGAVALGDPEIAENIRRKRILGIDKDTWHRYRNERSWFYEVTMQGFRYHMSNINAAIGLVQLSKMPRFIEERRQIVRLYNERLEGLDGLELLWWNLEEAAPFTYILRVLNGRRDEAMEFLSARGVGTGVHYIANHLQPFFEPFVRSPLPVTEQVWREILTLPLHSEMSDDEVEQVIDGMTAFCKG